VAKATVADPGEPPMTRALRLSLLVTDISFLIYWSLSALMQSGLLHVPREMMYAHFDDPRVLAWNWSFLPVDLAFSATGIAAVAASRRGDPVWRPLALLSLAFTMVAGGMAVAYWTLLGEFELTWFLPNLALVIWPMLFLPGLVCDTPSGGSAPARS
jgi:hypothetical protein